MEVDSIATEIPLMMVSPVILKNDAKLTNHNNVLPDLSFLNTAKETQRLLSRGYRLPGMRGINNGDDTVYNKRILYRYGVQKQPPVNWRWRYIIEKRVTTTMLLSAHLYI